MQRLFRNCRPFFHPPRYPDQNCYLCYKLFFRLQNYLFFYQFSALELFVFLLSTFLTGQFSVVLMIHNEQAGLSLSSPQLIKKKLAFLEHSSILRRKRDSILQRSDIQKKWMTYQLGYQTVKKKCFSPSFYMQYMQQVCK